MGEAIIVASSSTNSHLCGFSRVRVIEPKQLKFVMKRSEVLVSSHPKFININDAWNDFDSNLDLLSIGLAMLDSNGRSLTNCLQVGSFIKLKPLDSTVIEIISGNLFNIYDLF